MSGIHDVGGQTGFGPIKRETAEPPFHADWEARVLAINRVLLGKGIYNLDEFRATVEAISPAQYSAMSYYERWLVGIETLVAARASDTGAEKTPVSG